MSARYKAFIVHLACSLIIASLVLFLVFLLWYPDPLDKALNVTHIFILLLGVDVVLGPFLTLLVFRVGKKSLFFDMSVILLLQVSALFYGLWIVAEGRPAWVVFNVDRFDLVQVVDIDARQLDEAESKYRVPSLVGPRWVGAMRPEDPELRQTIMFEAATWGIDIAQRPQLYRSLEQFSDQISSRAQSLDLLHEFNETNAVHHVLSEWPNATAWLPLKARAKPMVVLLGENRSEVLAIVDLNPW